MKILVISFYYEPDLSACAFRTTSFVNALKKHIKKDDIIEVVTTFPNRYDSFKVETDEFQREDNVIIKRIKIPQHKSGFYDQSKSFLIYFIKTLKYVNKKKYHIVFATSSRLFTAFLGAIIARRKKIQLYLDIRDIFVDTLKSVLKDSKLRYIIPLFQYVEKFTIESAYKINLISEGFEQYFKERYQKEYSFFLNGIDDDFLNFNFSDSKAMTQDRIIFTYAGNIGEGQGLEKIIPKIAEKYKNIEFYVIGDGGGKNTLREYTANLKNVKLFNPVKRSELIEFYKNSGILFLQLNNYDAFTKVLPSKLFEYAATYKPIIAGVDGYARKFVEKYLPDTLVYKPCDFEDFCYKYNNFKWNINAEKRKNFIDQFSRRKIMNEMAKDFLGIVL